ncbi:MAG: lipopolysaccharide biosynthesis protein [Gaiellaceae bacterium]
MRKRLLRRSMAAVGLYSSVVLGFLGTAVAARTFSRELFGLFTLVVVATGFSQMLLDLTVEEALVKYGIRYSTRADWGRLRGLFRGGLVLKLAGGLLGGLGLLVLAPFADSLFGAHGATKALLVAAALPVVQSVEGLAGAVLFVRNRYDIRSALLAVSTGLRFAGIVVGVRFGLVQTVVGIVVAQAVATATVGGVALAAFRRFPSASARPLGEDRSEVVRFVLQSSAATGVLSLRGALSPLLLGIATSTVQMGYFKVAQAPQQGFNALSAPARMILLTEQTHDWERGRQSAVLRGVRRYSLAAAALMAAALPPLLWFMPDLIRLVYSAKYLGATDASRVLAVAAAVVFVVGWTKSFPVTIGRPNLRIWTHGLEALIVLPLVGVLGAAYGATGAAIALLAGTCAFALAWVLIFLRVRPDDSVPEPLGGVIAEEIEAAAL